MKTSRQLIPVVHGVLLVLVAITSAAERHSCMTRWLIFADIPHDNATSYSTSLAEVSATIDLLERANSDFLAFFGITDPEHQTKIVRCAKVPRCASACRNEGECLSDGKTFSCRCPAGFSGKRCETDLCNPNPCRNSGKCRRHDKTGFQCECSPGYQGRQCSEMTNKCDLNPCKNHVRCKPLVNDFQCVCLPTYHGKRCEQRWINRTSYTAHRDGTKIDLTKLGKLVSNNTASLARISKSLAANKALIASLSNSMNRLTERVGTVEERPQDDRKRLEKLGWLNFPGTQCYYKAIISKANFDTARRNCQALPAIGRRADLAVIKSAGENRFIISRVRPRYRKVWIGGSDRAREGDWRWIDGSRLSFTDWYHTEPNNYLGNEGCLTILDSEYSFKWNDDTCSLLFPAVCKVCI